MNIDDSETITKDELIRWLRERAEKAEEERDELKRKWDNRHMDLEIIAARLMERLRLLEEFHSLFWLDKDGALRTTSRQATRIEKIQWSAAGDAWQAVEAARGKE